MPEPLVFCCSVISLSSMCSQLTLVDSTVPHWHFRECGQIIMPPHTRSVDACSIVGRVCCWSKSCIPSCRILQRDHCIPSSGHQPGLRTVSLEVCLVNDQPVISCGGISRMQGCSSLSCFLLTHTMKLSFTMPKKQSPPWFLAQQERSWEASGLLYRNSQTALVNPACDSQAWLGTVNSERASSVGAEMPPEDDTVF